MCIITVYDDIKDIIIARFFVPDNREVIHLIYLYWRTRGLWIGIKESSLKFH